jgi:hypothetical protein
LGWNISSVAFKEKRKTSVEMTDIEPDIFEDPSSLPVRTQEKHDA